MVIVNVQTAGAGAGVGLVELPQPAPTRAAATKSSRASAIRRGIMSFSVPATWLDNRGKRWASRKSFKTRGGACALYWQSARQPQRAAW